MRDSHYKLLFSEVDTKLTLSQLSPDWFRIRGHSLLAGVPGNLGEEMFGVSERTLKVIIDTHYETDIRGRRTQQ